LAEEKKETKEKKTKSKGGPSPTESEEDFKYIVRLANTDLDGNKQVVFALTGIKGIGNRMAEILVKNSGVPKFAKIGSLSEDEINRLAEAIEALAEKTPGWLMNRRRDSLTGEDIHLIDTDILTFLRDDINLLKKIRCYRGIRHEQGKKVRGQRTRSNGRTGLTVGVSRKGVKK
jgi:small subunit ribosomal protein S13